MLPPKINFFPEPPRQAPPAVRLGPNVSRMGVHVETPGPRAAPTRPTPPTTTSRSPCSPTPWRPSGPSAEQLSASTDTSGFAEAAIGRRRSGSGSFPVGATSARARPSSLDLLDVARRARFLSGEGRLLDITANRRRYVAWRCIIAVAFSCEVRGISRVLRTAHVLSSSTFPALSPQ